MNRWWKSCRRSMRRCLPSRLSTCPRSHRTGHRSAWGTVCVSRRWRTSWWMCPRSSPILRCTGLWSRTWTFQFSVAGGGVFKGYAQNRMQLRLSSSKPLTFQFRVVEVFQALAPGQGSAASSCHVGAADDAGLGFFFRTFPREKISAGFGPHSRSELAADFNPWTPAAYAESEPESEAEVEEGAVTRFAAGFRPLRVCMRFLEHQVGRPVWECAYGDRCTFAHSWAELHPEASAHEQQLASYFD